MALCYYIGPFKNNLYLYTNIYKIMGKVIFTIDSRENGMFGVLKQYFNISDQHMSDLIGGMHDTLVDQLAAKGIVYADLKSVLVPQKKRRELVLVFDTLQMNEAWYGLACFNALIKLLDKKSSHSFLCGDYISIINSSWDNSNSLLYQSLMEHVNLSKIEYKSSEQLFLIYINNVSNALKEKLNAGLQSFQGFVGIADVTLSSSFKIYISSILTNGFIQHGDIILQPASEDRDIYDSKNYNELGYDFEDNGFKIRSIYGDLYGVFLTYKIERRYFHTIDASDQAMSINSIIPVFRYLSTATIIVTPEKLKYLKQERTDTMHRIGFDNITPEYLTRQIKENINSNYLFCMEFNETYQIAKFNIMIEFNSYKIQVGLKYDHIENTLSLLTMF